MSRWHNVTCCDSTLGAKALLSALQYGDEVCSPARRLGHIVCITRKGCQKIWKKKSSKSRPARSCRSPTSKPWNHPKLFPKHPKPVQDASSRFWFWRRGATPGIRKLTLTDTSLSSLRSLVFTFTCVHHISQRLFVGLLSQAKLIKLFLCNIVGCIHWGKARASAGLFFFFFFLSSSSSAIGLPKHPPSSFTQNLTCSSWAQSRKPLLRSIFVGHLWTQVASSEGQNQRPWTLPRLHAAFASRLDSQHLCGAHGLHGTELSTCAQYAPCCTWLHDMAAAAVATHGYMTLHSVASRQSSLRPSCRRKPHPYFTNLYTLHIHIYIYISIYIYILYCIIIYRFYTSCKQSLSRTWNGSRWLHLPFPCAQLAINQVRRLWVSENCLGRFFQ